MDSLEHLKINSQFSKYFSTNKSALVKKSFVNDLSVGWQNLNLLSHPYATLAPQTRQSRASAENLKYLTLAPQERPSGEILNYSLSH